MAELFAMFKEHLVWGLMLWVVIFVGFAAWFGRGQLTPFAQAIGRALLAIVVSPFVFIRRAVTACLGFTPADEESYRASDHYLLNKGTVVVQAIVIVLAVGVLAAGVVATWNAWVPPSEVRRAAREYRERTEAQREKTAQTASALTQLDEDWKQKEGGILGTYRQARQTRASNATRDLAQVEKDLAAFSGDAGKRTFNNVKEAAGRADDSRRSINNTKSRLDSIVYNQWYWISAWERQTMNRWNELWHAKTLAEHELRNIPVDELRAEAQPTFAEVKANNEREAATLASMEEILKQHQEAASLKWKRAGKTALSSFLTFLLFVWFWGAFVEAARLVVRVADDVRRLREANAPAPAATAAATVGEATEVDARLPIRDVARQVPIAPPPV